MGQARPRGGGPISEPPTARRGNHPGGEAAKRAPEGALWPRAGRQPQLGTSKVALARAGRCAGGADQP
eukprot:6052564-Pyramimonas_sp.AAC.1